MLTAEDIQEAARTGTDLPGLPIDDLVKLTKAGDWSGTLFELRFEAASQIASQINGAQPAAIGQRRTRKRKALAPAQ